MITLFGNLESGNVHKVQMILRRIQKPYRRVDVSQIYGETKSEEFVKLNPVGKIPAVLFDDGDVLSESGAILYFFAQGTDLWPTSTRVQAEVLRWMFFEQYSHEPSLAVIRYLKHFATEAPTHPNQVSELETKARRSLCTMQYQLESHQWIAGQECSIADYALYPYTRTADQSGFELSEFPAVETWVGRIEQLPHFIPFTVDGSVESMSFTEYLRTEA